MVGSALVPGFVPAGEDIKVSTVNRIWTSVPLICTDVTTLPSVSICPDGIIAGVSQGTEVYFMRAHWAQHAKVSTFYG